MSKFYKDNVVNIGNDKLVISAIHDIYNKSDKKNKENIEKDLGKQILSKFRLDIKDLIKKSLEIKSLRVVKHDKYYDVLNESIDSYILGHYRASIACCGVACELIASELSKTIKKTSLSPSIFEDFNQHTRIVVLYLMNLINQDSYQKMNSIREIRNSYIHNPSKTNNRNDAKKCINNLVDIIKIIYKPKK